MGKNLNLTKTPMPMNRADIGFVVCTFLAEISSAAMTGFINLSRFAAQGSNHIDAKKIARLQRREFEDAVRYDLESIEVKDG